MKILLLIAVALLLSVGGAIWYQSTTKPLLVAAGSTSLSLPDGASQNDSLLWAEDVERLGCNVDPALGKYQERSVPNSGMLKVYRLESRQDCRVLVLSTIQPVNTVAGNIWNDEHTLASAMAARFGLQFSIGRGNLGDTSEIARFTRNGRYQGFLYLIENQRTLYSLVVIANTGAGSNTTFSIEPTQLLEQQMTTNIPSLGY